MAMGNRRQPAAINRKNMDFKVLGRVLGYMMKRYKFRFILVLVCILITAVTTLVGMLFMQSLIDDYITPMLNVVNAGGTADFAPLLGALVRIALIYVVGIISSFTYNRLMIYITQGTMRDLRNDIFTHMESLPIKYFDTNAHGDIMSIYTNDVDTLRQLISQSIPQMVNSLVTLIITFVSMIVLSIPLTVLTVVMVLVMMFAASKIGGKSAKYFGAQQKDLGIVNGYIEEMMEGQKVVKVFNHEEKNMESFRQLNDQLRVSADPHACQREPRKYQLRALRCSRRGAFSGARLRRDRTYPRFAGRVPYAEQELLSAGDTGQPAAQRSGYGYGGREACI